MTQYEFMTSLTANPVVDPVVSVEEEIHSLFVIGWFSCLHIPVERT